MTELQEKIYFDLFTEEVQTTFVEPKKPVAYIRRPTNRKQEVMGNDAAPQKRKRHRKRKIEPSKDPIALRLLRDMMKNGDDLRVCSTVLPQPRVKGRPRKKRAANQEEEKNKEKKQQRDKKEAEEDKKSNKRRKSRGPIVCNTKSLLQADADNRLWDPDLFHGIRLYLFPELLSDETIRSAYDVLSQLSTWYLPFRSLFTGKSETAENRRRRWNQVKKMAVLVRRRVLSQLMSDDSDDHLHLPGENRKVVATIGSHRMQCSEMPPDIENMLGVLGGEGSDYNAVVVTKLPNLESSCYWAKGELWETKDSMMSVLIGHRRELYLRRYQSKPSKYHGRMRKEATRDPLDNKNYCCEWNSGSVLSIEGAFSSLFQMMIPKWRRDKQTKHSGVSEQGLFGDETYLLSFQHLSLVVEDTLACGVN